MEFERQPKKESYGCLSAVHMNKETSVKVAPDSMIWTHMAPHRVENRWLHCVEWALGGRKWSNYGLQQNWTSPTLQQRTGRGLGNLLTSIWGCVQSLRSQELAIFLIIAGSEALNIYNCMQLSQAEQTDYEIVLKKFKEYCTPRKNETFERSVPQEVTKRGRTLLGIWKRSQTAKSIL